MKMDSVSSVSSVSQSTTSFQGQVITKGVWPKTLAQTFHNAKGINDLAVGDNVVIGSLKTKIVSSSDIRYDVGDRVYKLKLKIAKEKPTLLDRIKIFFGLTTHVVNKHYHSEDGLNEIINIRTKDSYSGHVKG